MFVPLNVKSEYSFLSSCLRLDAYLDAAVSLGFKTIGLCDEENLHGAVKFVRGAKAKGLQPVLGMQGTWLVDGVPVPLAFIALGTVGYHGLLRISTRKNRGEADFPSDLTEDLAVVVPLDYASLAANGVLSNLTELYVGLQQGEVAPEGVRGLPFPSVRYLTAADGETLQVLGAIREMGAVDESLAASGKESLLRPEIFERGYDVTVRENLQALVAGIHYELSSELQLPRFNPVRDAADELREKAEQGLEVLVKSDSTAQAPKKVSQALVKSDNDYRRRLQHELAVIHEMGFNDYFLIVADLLAYAAREGIYCGMGRGSAAGSLVAYALGITHIDPVENDLLFERFLNPERASMPDIDIDIPDNRRAELLSYMQNRYGSDHVAQIVTFSTFGKRQALRDVGKAYGMTEVEVNSLTRLTTTRFSDLAAEYEQNLKFRAEILRNPLLQKVFRMAQKIEGLPRQTSIHASGVVLTEEALYHYTPLKPGEDLSLTQYEAPDIESLGLLKIDFLGLRNLALIEDLRQLVKEHHKLDIDPLAIDLEDEKTLALFRAGDTMGIFQFENPQMRRFLRNLAPTQFDDIVNATSIFRPGPSQFIPQFIARRHGKEAVPSMDASVDDLLARTYGIMIYQEQVMLVAVRFAGFSMGRADSLRRAISKKKGSEFERLQAEFISGAVLNGHTTEKAQEIYDLIVRFANYGFNRSHAVAYAALAFQIAYYKANFPAEFYEVHLKGYKRETMLADALDNGYEILPPDINRMPYHDKVTPDKKISLGLAHITGFPKDFALWILENRPFTDFSDFVKRTPTPFQREDILASLVRIGAFDTLSPNRGKLLANLTRLIDFYQTLQLDLFGKTQLAFAFEDAPDLSITEKYNDEMALLGVAVTPHPLKNWATRFHAIITPISQLTPRTQATILVQILRIRALTTKNNERMAFLEVTDTHQTLTVVLFPETYRAVLATTNLEVGKLYLIAGKTELREEEIQLQATKLTEITETTEKLWLSVTDDTGNQRLAALLRRFPGPVPVVLHTDATKETRQSSLYVAHSESLLKQLRGLVTKAIYQ
ncbi:MAG: DNA polymerase III subunit alpha [Streptococcaceae bacterium]|jgi:DNA polymerase-3 subunit alpha|nr:DNA polymerase III subunit alpha [Streptococcaceae bacterium]